MSRINLTIDQLVLRGFEFGERKALVEALQTELSQVLADPVTRGEWACTHRTSVLRLRQRPMESGVSGRRKFGKSVARDIAKGLKA